MLAREELAAAGVPDPLDRALLASGALLLLAAILPAGEDAGRPVFLSSLLDREWGALALIAQLLAGLALCLLGSATSNARRLRATVGLVLITAALAPFVLHPELREALLPHQPAALRKGAPLFFTALVLSSAALVARRDPGVPAWVARTSAALALAVAILLFTWPHRSGALVLVLAGGLGEMSLALAPLSLALLTAARVLLPGRPRASELAWMLVIPAGITLSLGLEIAVATGADVHLILALRSVLLLVAAAITGAFSAAALMIEPSAAPTEDRPRTARAPESDRDWAEQLAAASRAPSLPAPSPAAPDLAIPGVGPDGAPARARLRLGLILATGATLAATGYVAGAETGAERRPALRSTLSSGPGSRLGAVPGGRAWADVLYGELLPALAAAAEEESKTMSIFDPLALPSEASRARLRRAVELARPAPELARAVEELARTLQYGGATSRELAHVEEHVNHAAEEAGLPYWLDLQLLRMRSSTGLVTRIIVSTYHIRRSRRGVSREETVRSLWLERAEANAVVEQRLGWKRPGESRGMIVLDGIVARLSGELAPGLTADGASTTGHLYARLVPELEEDLSGALAAALPLEEDAELTRLLWGYLRCASGEGTSSAEEEQECRGLTARVEPILTEVLAKNVEAHELQHALDRDEVYVPAELRRLMRHHGEDLIEASAAELSAYLAEIGRGALPRLALIDLAAFHHRYPRSAEGFAGELALAAMREESETTFDLARLPSGVIAERARSAYAELFGTPLPEVVFED